MDLLIPSGGLLFWMTLVFLLVFFILWKWGFPSIVKMVEDRKAYIDDSLRKAHEANEKLANIQKESESIMQKAREQQASILREASATRDTIVEQAQEKVLESFPKPELRLRPRNRMLFVIFVIRLLSSVFRLQKRFCMRSFQMMVSRWNLLTDYWMTFLLL